ncbi:AvrD family protein [Kitasatospora sp. NBC_01287]|uniref:AvrD family protein n=1 Tax=Kitasatospora sp. NBC_01287 TaxID=2903573 RepID=UPI002256E786|nr:AvrD family protein [Kitasatospora sp. NBC_01287]MCX4747727.1 AvrD family protein [Kitasatospora sp. NBC_01287]
MTDLMSPLLLSDSIDDLLGPAESRFFGSGYRRVGQRVHQLSWDEEHQTLNAVAGVLYPVDWSVKQKAGKLAPHLSTIDALLFAAQLAETALTARYGLTEEQRRAAWLRKVEIRAGAAPQEEGLTAFPASAQLKESPVAPLDQQALVSLVVCRIGRMTVRCTVEHAAGTGARVEVRDDLLGPVEQRPYGTGYRAHRQALTDLRVDAHGLVPTVDGKLAVTAAPSEAIGTRGLEGAYQPGITLVDAFVTALQLGQVLLYELDSVARADSNTLWMRRTVLESSRPDRPGAQAAPVTAILEAAQIVQAQGADWRNADIVAETGGVRVVCSVTHKLPEAAHASEEQAVLRAAA